MTKDSEARKYKINKLYYNFVNKGLDEFKNFMMVHDGIYYTEKILSLKLID